MDLLTLRAPSVARMLRDGHYELSATDVLGLLNGGMSVERLEAVLKSNFRAISEACAKAGQAPVRSGTTVDVRAGQRGLGRAKRRR